MDKQVSREVSSASRLNEKLFSGLGADALAVFATANSDVTVIIGEDSRVVDIAYRDRALKAWDLENWVGKPWKDTVTVESRDKIDELIDESHKASPTRLRQVNHPGKTGRDLPVSYRLVALTGWPHRVALGTDLRPLAEMQQRLVRSQIEMEKDYRKLRDIESRYRILFHLAVEPLVVIEAQTLKILDANEGAARMLDKPVKKLIGSVAGALFAKADQSFATESLSMLAARGRADVFRARPATGDVHLEVRVTPFREYGRTNLLVCFASEANTLVDTRAPLDSSMLSMIDNLPEGVVMVDDEGRVVRANTAFLDMIRVVSIDHVEDKMLDNWLGGSSVDLHVLLANLREHGTVRRFSSVIRDEVGGTEQVEVSAARIEGENGQLFGFTIREQSRGETGPAVGLGGIATPFTELVGRVPLKDLVRDTADIIERLCIEAALRLTDNNRASAADMLGLSRQSLYIKLKRYGISDPEEE